MIEPTPCPPLFYPGEGIRRHAARQCQGAAFCSIADRLSCKRGPSAPSVWRSGAFPERQWLPHRNGVAAAADRRRCREIEAGWSAQQGPNRGMELDQFPTTLRPPPFPDLAASPKSTLLKLNL